MRNHLRRLVGIRRKLLLAGMICLCSLACAKEAPHIKRVSAGSAMTVRFHSGIPAGRYLVPETMPLAIAFDALPSGVLLMSAGRAFPLECAFDDSLVYSIPRALLERIRKNGTSFTVQWNGASPVEFELCPAYPVPRITYMGSAGTHTLFEPVILVVGPLLRQPQRIALEDPEGNLHPVTVLKNWTPAAPTVTIRCSFEQQPSLHHLHLYDGNEPLQFLSAGIAPSSDSLPFVLEAGDVIRAPLPSLLVASPHGTHVLLSHANTRLDLIEANQRIDPVQLQIVASDDARTAAAASALRREIQRSGSLRLMKASGPVADLRISAAAPLDEDAWELITLYPDVEDVSPAYAIIPAADRAGGDTIWFHFEVLQELDTHDMAIVLDRSTLMPGDTLSLNIFSDNVFKNNLFEPVVRFDAIRFTTRNHFEYTAYLPPGTPTGEYEILLKPRIRCTRQTDYSTHARFTVNDLRGIETTSRFVRMIPDTGFAAAAEPRALDRETIQQLHVFFDRDSLRRIMGPQFLQIRTTVRDRDGKTLTTSEQRAVTFRSSGVLEEDHARYRTYMNRYYPFALVQPQRLDAIPIECDTLPDWSRVEVLVQSDNGVHQGRQVGVPPVRRNYIVRGARWETRLVIGVPKVLYDSNADDTVTYGNYSTTLRFFYLSPNTGEPFPLNIGFGIFGVNSPLDIGNGGGGFIISLYADVVELLRSQGLSVTRNFDAGIALAPFFPIGHRGRILVNLRLGLSIWDVFNLNKL